MKAINRDRDDDKEIHDVVVIVTRYTRVKGDLDLDLDFGGGLWFFFVG